MAPAATTRLAPRQQVGAALGLLQRGQMQQGAAALDQLLRAFPEDPTVNGLAGAVALQGGNRPLAIKLLSVTLKHQPNDAGAQSNMGLALLGERQLAAAETHLRRALELKPDVPGTLVNLGNLRRERGDLEGAEALLRRALALQPTQVEAQNSLALVLEATGRVDAARDAAEAAVRLNPNFAAAHGTLGLIRDQLGDRQGALAAHAMAIKLAPQVAQHHADQASTLLAFGLRDEAKAAYRRAVDLAPANGNYRRLLGSVDSSADTIEERAARFADPAMPDDDRMHLGFALGRDAEKAGDYPAAFNYLETANRLRRAAIRYDAAETAAQFDELIAAFSPETVARLSGGGDPDATPIFVLGLPRSGTTLVEQILASHRDVVGAGELLALRNVATEATRERPVRFGPLLAAQDHDRLRALGADYVRRLRAYAPSGAPHVTDKMPGNFMLIGLIRLILPNARIIHCSRDPLDNALSIWRSYFSAALNYSYDFDELGHYCRHYKRIMVHWEKLFPGSMLTVRNEQLVADQEGETRRLLSHCGLDWDPACLDFHRADRPVHTVSAAQVRVPINDRSIGVAARYGALLDPLRAALEGGEDDVSDPAGHAG